MCIETLKTATVMFCKSDAVSKELSPVGLVSLENVVVCPVSAVFRYSWFNATVVTFCYRFNHQAFYLVFVAHMVKEGNSSHMIFNRVDSVQKDFQIGGSDPDFSKTTHTRVCLGQQFGSLK